MRTPLADAVTRIGDRWSLLIVDALLERPLRFGDLQETVTGIAPNILSGRLKALEAEGVLLAVQYCARPPRSVYELTGAGRGLAGALRLLTQWGARHAPAGSAGDGGGGSAEDWAEGALRHDACGTPAEVRWYCPTCAQVLADHEASDLHHL
jgi:DNA-binding HxlR family transcriptional regulator